MYFKVNPKIPPFSVVLDHGSIRRKPAKILPSPQPSHTGVPKYTSRGLNVKLQKVRDNFPREQESKSFLSPETVEEHTPGLRAAEFNSHISISPFQQLLLETS